MKKIKIFTNHYFPENFKINSISQYLSDFYEVSVVTQIPNYPEGDFFKGYGFSKKRQDYYGNVKVDRLSVIPRKKNSLLLFLNYVSYLISSTIYSLVDDESVDYVLTYITSPIFISWAGLRTAKRQNVPHILYLLDLWPDTLFAIRGIKSSLFRIIFTGLCRNIYDRCDKIIVSSESFIPILEGYGVDRSKLVFIPQHAEDIRIDPRDFVDTDLIKVVFTGNVGEAQGLDILVKSAEILKEESFTDVIFTIVGDGRYKKTLESLIEIAGVEKYFDFIGHVKHTEISKVLKNQHFGFISLKDEEPFNKTIPAKLQNYMSEGMPIIGSVTGEAANIINASKCGFCLESGNPKLLAELIKSLVGISTIELSKMSKNAIDFAKMNFDKETNFGLIKETIENTPVKL